jgi:hypothetical protein
LPGLGDLANAHNQFLSQAEGFGSPSAASAG